MDKNMKGRTKERMDLLMTTLAFSPAVSSRNMEPWPGEPGQLIHTLNAFLGMDGMNKEEGSQIRIGRSGS